MPVVAGPPQRRAVAFVDGQNLFHSAREAFGYRFPNYDPVALARAACTGRPWTVSQVRFYTGVPNPTDNAFWDHFWTAKCAAMGRQGVVVYTRRLRYHSWMVTLPDGTEHTIVLGEEKGIDVRIALDVIRLAHRRAYDVGIVFSQDQDLAEVAPEIQAIAKEQRRWIKLASAFPIGSDSRNPRGVNGTDWIKLDRAAYDQCLDPGDYRPRGPSR